jgi:hypothetical protein
MLTQWVKLPNLVQKTCLFSLFFFILSWHADLKEELIKALEEKLMAGE